MPFPGFPDSEDEQMPSVELTGRTADLARQLQADAKVALQLQSQSQSQQPNYVDRSRPQLQEGVRSNQMMARNSTCWFRDNDLHLTTVYRENIVSHDERCFRKWNDVGRDIIPTDTSSDSLWTWLGTVDIGELTRLLDTVPHCTHDVPHPDPDSTPTPGFSFTKFQILALVCWLHAPFDRTCSMKLGAEQIKRIAGFDVRKKIPICQTRSVVKGFAPDHCICTFPTGCGKTSWALAAVSALLCSNSWHKLNHEKVRNNVGKIITGPPTVKIARLAIIATAVATANHFKTALEGLIPVLTDKWKVKIEVWDSWVKRPPKHYSVEDAFNGQEDTVYFWHVPLRKLNVILREHPFICVAAMVNDEFTVDTPKFRSLVASEVLKVILTQATPQALVEATTGNDSWLKALFDGPIIPPCGIANYVSQRNWRDAQKAVDQWCKLTMLSTNAFREPICKDLAPLVPKGLEVHHVRTSSISLAAHISGSQADLVPANLVNLILSTLGFSYLTQDSRERIQNINEATLRPREILERVRAHKRTTTFTALSQENRLCMETNTQRLINRLEEFVAMCPICYTEAPNDKVKIYGCCGYAVCDDCVDPTSRTCPFCRKNLITTLPRSSVQEPQPAAPAPTYTPEATFHDNLMLNVNERMSQKSNLETTLKVALHHGMKRVVIVVENNGGRYDSGPVDWDIIGTTTGYHIDRVDELLQAGTKEKSEEFAKLKRQFDTPSNDAMGRALCCIGTHDEFLVGTDLACADLAVLVGEIPEKQMTQALGRIFRPRVGRNNDAYFHMVKIFSQRSDGSVLGVRRRDTDSSNRADRVRF